MRFRSLAVAVAVVALLAVSVDPPAQASAGSMLARVPATSYPTWAEVQKAKSNAKQAKLEYQKVTAALASLQAQAAAAADAQLAAQAAYTTAQQAVDAASTTAAALSKQSASAAADAAAAEQQLGSLASQQYRANGASTTLQLFAGGIPPEQLLRTLGTLSRLTSQTAGLQQEAATRHAVAASLAAQAASAKKTLARLSAIAQTALQKAQAAAAAAKSVLADTQQRSQTLYSQAATLANTSVDIQKKYLERQQYLADLKRKQDEEAASGGSTDQLYLIAQGLHPDPAAAQAYAKSRLGSYGWDSGTQWQCLVQLWTIESGWRVNAYNPSSAAYGIPQAWPATKMAAYGSDWMTNPKTQIDWGLAYISSSYSTPCAALNFETSHTPYWY